VSGQPASPIHPDFSLIDNIGTEDFANQPWTEQPGGCGQVGHGIKVPMKFINLDLNQDSSPDGGRRLYKNSWELRLKGKKSKHMLSTTFFGITYVISNCYFPQNFYIIQRAMNGILGEDHELENVTMWRKMLKNINLF
jgi:hypothetical protein